MIISVNWLKKFTDIDLPIDELASLIGARLVEIEKVVDLGTKYKDVIIVRVVECAPIENTDHLNLTKIDDGGVWKDVERDDKGLVTVVCGAPNVRAGMLAVWLPPTSIVPETYDDSEPFVLSAKKLRGAVSNGMLASAKELGLFDDHTGIVEIYEEVEAGTYFAKTYELDDYLLDIENKSLTHRPDAFGIIGFAREVAAITGKTFVTPEWLVHEQPTYGELQKATTAPTIYIDDPDISDRYQAVILSNADATRHSPFEIQTYLARVGVRPINAIVDVTNYMMMLTGQPLHAFDYDKVQKIAGDKNEIHVRRGREHETLALLDGRVIELTPDDIVIAAGETAIGLAGAMGGASTTIDENTKNIIIESATFNLYSLRGTQMRHGIFSEAITRFTKGQPAKLTAPVLAGAIERMAEWTGAVRVSDVVEERNNDIEDASIIVSVERINAILGTALTIEYIESCLRSVEFAVATKDGNTLSVSPPYWRADIHIPEDIIEEIGRIGGFDSITPTLPSRDFTAVRPTDFDQLRTRLRSILARSGANEVLSYSFIHGDNMKKVGQDTAGAYRVINSISPELQYYRQSITPSLLANIHSNIKAGYNHFALFELNKFHTKRHGVNEEGVPKELDSLAFVIAAKKAPQERAFYAAKRHLEFIAEQLGISFTYEPLEADSDYPVTQPYEPKRSARVLDALTGERVGVVGEFRSTVRTSFKLPDYSAGFEISPRALLQSIDQNGYSYSPLSKYPSSERDVCYQVDHRVTYGEITGLAEEAIEHEQTYTRISPIDIFQQSGSDKKNITIRITITPLDHTLTASEVTDIIANMNTVVIAKTHAVVV